MYKLAVCDDSKAFNLSLKKHLLEYSFQHDFDYSLDEFCSGESLLASSVRYDLIFMDYLFEGQPLNGIDISKRLRDKEVRSFIVFSSSFPSMVFDSLEVQPFRFLVKPIDKNILFNTLDSFLASLNRSKDILRIRSNGTERIIHTQTISYIEAVGKYCIIHFADGSRELENHETLAATNAELNTSSFYRCFKSYVINLRYISSIAHTYVELSTGEQLPISRNRYNELRDIYSDYIIQSYSLSDVYSS